MVRDDAGADGASGRVPDLVSTTWASRCSVCKSEFTFHSSARAALARRGRLFFRRFAASVQLSNQMLYNVVRRRRVLPRS